MQIVHLKIVLMSFYELCCINAYAIDWSSYMETEFPNGFASQSQANKKLLFLELFQCEIWLLWQILEF